MSKFADPAAPAPAAFRALDPPLTRSAIQKRHPHLDVAVIDPLAHVWDEVVHRIIQDVLELSMVDQSPLHINVREEMVFELAKLQVWLAETVVEKRLAQRDPTTVDLPHERLACLGPDGCGSIKSTAKLVYEQIWAKRMEERWKPKSLKATERDANPRRIKLSPKPVTKNHFIPLWFIRDNWAVSEKTLRWQRGDQGWKSTPRGFAQWGFRRNLYSDRIEAYLGLIEGDAKIPVQMLLDMVPLNGPQRDALVGFFVAQIIRSPFFIDTLRQKMEPVIADLGHGADPTLVFGAFETLYQNNKFYQELAHPLMWSEWAIVKAPSPVFVLPDTFSARGMLDDGLRMIVPLTPTKCFVTLPAREGEKRIVPYHVEASEQLARRVSSVLVRSASTQFLSHPQFRIDGSVEPTVFADLLREIEAVASRSRSDPL